MYSFQSFILPCPSFASMSKILNKSSISCFVGPAIRTYPEQMLLKSGVLFSFDRCIKIVTRPVALVTLAS